VARADKQWNCSQRGGEKGYEISWVLLHWGDHISHGGTSEEKGSSFLLRGFGIKLSIEINKAYKEYKRQ